MEAILIHPNNKEQLAAVKAFAKALKMTFETKEVESPYDPEFVAKIEQSEKQVREGKVHTNHMNPEVLYQRERRLLCCNSIMKC